jgi:sugar/nucleoside kinase (ribokinase family)
LGAEIFHQTADTIGGGDATGFSAGGIYDLSAHYHLLFSGGRGLKNAATANQASYYLALQSTF